MNQIQVNTDATVLMMKLANTWQDADSILVEQMKIAPNDTQKKIKFIEDNLNLAVYARDDEECDDPEIILENDYRALLSTVIDLKWR